MTAGHADWGEELTHDVDGRHNKNGVQEAFEIPADAGGLDLVVGDENKDHQRPGKLRHQIRRGAPDAHKANKIGDDAGYKNGAHQGDVPIKLRPHFVVNEIYQGIDDGFRGGLLPGDAGDLQPGAQPDAQGGDDQHDQPAHNQGLGDVDRSQYRDIFEGGENFCAVD